MSEKKVTHDTFVLERTLNASPERVYAVLSDPEKKARWFAGPTGWTLVERSLDFRVGGREVVNGNHKGGMSSLFEARYFDIVPNERIVYTYEMTVNGRKISVSLATFEIVSQGAKTVLRLTEQGTYFEDPAHDTYAPHGQHASRLEGTKGLMDRLASAIEAA